MSANEQSPTPDSPKTDVQTPAGRPPAQQPSHAQTSSGSPPRGGRVSSGLALILALAALLGTGYVWYTLIYQHPELVKMDLPGELADLQHTTDELKNLADKTNSQIGVLTETQNTLKTAVDNMQAELGKNQAQWIISETEQLLLIANRRLQLARDVGSALAALRAADRQLELLASPTLLPVRKEIANEITQLESIDRTDITGIALRLGSLADRVDALPLASDLRNAAEQLAAASTTTGKNGKSMWQDLIGLVKIRRHDAVRRPLLPPGQQYFARENLRLMLYGAQHALLQGNVQTYQQNLATANRWLGEYYDTESTAVDAARKELDKLQATPVMNELPNIATSLEMLRKASGRHPGS